MTATLPTTTAAIEDRFRFIVLRRLRELNWTQKRLAFEANIGYKTLNQALGGRRSMTLTMWDACMTVLGLRIVVAQEVR